MLANYFDTSIDFLVGNTEVRHKVEQVHPHDLNAEEASLLEKYRRLPAAVRSGIITLMDALLQP